MPQPARVARPELPPASTDVAAPRAAPQVVEVVHRWAAARDAQALREVRSIAGSFRMIAWIFVLEFVFVLILYGVLELRLYAFQRDIERALQPLQEVAKNPGGPPLP